MAQTIKEAEASTDEEDEEDEEGEAEDEEDKEVSGPSWGIGNVPQPGPPNLSGC